MAETLLPETMDSRRRSGQELYDRKNGQSRWRESATPVHGMIAAKGTIGAYYNALRPTGAGTWQLRTEVTFIF